MYALGLCGRQCIREKCYRNKRVLDIKMCVLFVEHNKN